MNSMISVTINVSKIKKEALFKGKNGSYLTLTLIPNKEGEDRYGNSHFVVQDLGKEARASGQRGEILGNAKTIQKRGAETRQKPEAQQQPDRIRSRQKKKFRFEL